MQLMKEKEIEIGKAGLNDLQELHRKHKFQ